ncbi:MAG: SDR family NAD(P)-dependent oxidoreductase [Lachnospiraceae bacterium]|nr:SDR family NAD(P)-dependent oxidoreductase [Lachnospiraceae bacterium]
MNIAVVTGASSGIGKEFVNQIAQKYKNIDEIWVIARRGDRLRKLAYDIANLSDEIYHDMPIIRPIVCDVTNLSDLLIYRSMLVKYQPKVRILVNAAGYGIIGKFYELKEADASGMCELNCTALTRMTRITLPYMDKRHANIINIASSAAFLPQPSFAVYAATKAYVLSFSMALRQELKKTGINVTAVCPGPVNTEFFDIAQTYHSVKLYKKLFYAQPRDVVTQALLDAYHGRARSVYGITMKLFEFISKVLPHDLIVRFIK